MHPIYFIDGKLFERTCKNLIACMLNESSSNHLQLLINIHIIQLVIVDCNCFSHLKDMGFSLLATAIFKISFQILVQKK